MRDKLNKRREEGLYRKLSFADKNCIDFSSNDYLGFVRFKQFWEPEDTQKYGSTGSRLLTGNTLEIEETEAFIAGFHNTESGLIFNSGYDANTGFFSCIAGKEDTIIYDEQIHASIKDGARLSTAKHYSFKHNDIESLEAKIKLSTGRIFIAIESVYSMDGDLAPLEEIVELASKYKNIYLIVDEAHATGVLGINGKGLVQEYGLEEHIFARIHTFGKAMGCNGAIIVGSKVLREYLINFSRSFIYTTALPLPNILAIKRAYQHLTYSNSDTVKLKYLTDYFQSKSLEFAIHGLKTNRSAIQILFVRGNDNARNSAKKLQEEGFDIRPVLSPTVPIGSERLRICLHAYNSKVEIDNLLSVLSRLNTLIN